MVYKNNFRLGLSFAYLMCIQLVLFGQPGIQWSRTYGGSNYDDLRSIEQTADGGYIVVGHTLSSNGNISGQNGSGDFGVFKLNYAGEIEWQKCLGGNQPDFANSVQQTSDGGYIVAGSTGSSNGDVLGNRGLVDYWLVKLDVSGLIQWQKCLGGSSTELAWSCRQTSDGGYVLAGYTYSNDGDVSGNHGDADFWIVKINSSGEIEWQKALGGSDADYARNIRQTADGGFIVVGSTESSDGDVSENQGGLDIWLVKLSASGALQWQSSFGGSQTDEAVSIQETSNGGFIVAGSTYSSDGDVLGNRGFVDNWLLKVNALGNLDWQRCIGGSNNDMASSIVQTVDGGYLLAGSSSSADGDVEVNFGDEDWYVAKLDSTGFIEWKQSFGGSSFEYPYAVYQSTDEGAIIAGYTASSDGDVTNIQGSVDGWIMKLGNIMALDSPSKREKMQVYPNPASQSTSVFIDPSLMHKSYRLVNHVGQCIASGTFVSTELTLSLVGMPAGLYKIVTESFVAGTTFIVVH